MKVFSKAKHIFFTGIGGIGMSGIAEICLESGFKVSGSDRELSDITEYLKDRGAIIYSGHSKDNIRNIDVLVYSSAIPANNPERQEALQQRIPVIRRAEMLAEIMRMKYGIAIAGTHGKTTTTSICAEIFIASQVDPTVVVGGRLKSLKTNARIGFGDFFITEADEFDRSFLALSPTFAVITSVDTDHLDCYSDFTDIKDSFVQFANKVSFYGAVICCNDDPVIREILPQFNKSTLTYGLGEGADYRAENIKYSGAHSYFDVTLKGQIIGKLDLPIPGKHNIKNTLAALAIALEVGISFEMAKKSIEKFQGVERRFEIKANVDNITIVDDYAHHPTEVKATLDSAKQIEHKRTIVIFQPHLYSRTRDFYHEFAGELSLCDLLIITEIYPAREKPLAGVSSALIVNEVQRLGFDQVHYIPDKSKIIEYLIDEVCPGDLVIFMGAGDIYKYAQELEQRLTITVIKN
jgi:UDP-N-acetylmuramate--alanine ligase